MSFICQVRAILVSEEAVKEARLEARIRSSKSRGLSQSAAGRLQEEILASGRLTEEVFLAQLYGRAQLLNEQFQRRVIRIVMEHEQGEQVGRSASLFKHSFHSAGGQPISADFIFSNSPSHPNSAQQIGSQTSGVAWASPLVGADMEQSALTDLPSLPIFSPRRAHSSGTIESQITFDESSENVLTVTCVFDEGCDSVEIHPAPVKT